MYLLYFGDIPNLVSCAFSTIPIVPLLIYRILNLLVSASDIQHIKGVENPVADALSLIELNTLTQHQSIDFEDMAKAQVNDPDLAQLQQASSSLQLEVVPVLISTTNM